MRLRASMWLGVFVLLVFAVLASTGAASSSAPRAGGTVVFGAEQEPGILNTDIIGGNLFWGAEVVSPVFPPSYRIYPDYSFRPELVSKVKVQGNPFRLTYYIKKNATWNEPGG